MLVEEAGSIELESLADWTAVTVAASGYGFEGNLLRTVYPKIEMLVMLCLPGLVHRYSTWHSRFGELVCYTVTITALTERTLYRPPLCCHPCNSLASAPFHLSRRKHISDLATLPLHIFNVRLQTSSELDQHFAPAFPPWRLSSIPSRCSSGKLANTRS